MSRPDRAVFRLPLISLLIPFLIAFCITPLANAGAPAFLAFYLFPVVALVYVLITTTVADAANIRASGLRGVRRIAWSDLDGLEFRGPRWATAVALDGRRIRLPMVRPRDMYRLAAVSGGRLSIGKDAPVPAQDVDDDEGVDNVEAIEHGNEEIDDGARADGADQDSADEDSPEEDGPGSQRTSAGALADDE